VAFKFGFLRGYVCGVGQCLIKTLLPLRPDVLWAGVWSLHNDCFVYLIGLSYAMGCVFGDCLFFLTVFPFFFRVCTYCFIKSFGVWRSNFLRS